MKVSEEFPSKHLKAADLQGKEVRLKIANVEREKLGDDNKLVVYFHRTERGFVLNKVNSYAIADAYGDDTDDWIGNDIILFPVRTDFKGKPVDAIRCRAPNAKDNRKKEDPISSGPARKPVASDDLDDSIPFAPEFR